MSVYRDIASGKWFDTLAELKAFQRGEVNPPPKPEPIQEPVVEKVEEVVEEEVDEKLEVSAEDEPEEVKREFKTKIKVSKYETVPTFEEIGMNRIKILEWLKENGFWYDNVKSKGDKALIKFYLVNKAEKEKE